MELLTYEWHRTVLMASQYLFIWWLGAVRQQVITWTNVDQVLWHHIASLRHNYIMTSSNGNIFRVTGPLCGEFTGPGEFPTQRPVTRSFDVFFDLRLNKRLSKQPWGWWFETPSWSLWRHYNELRSHYSEVRNYIIWFCLHFRVCYSPSLVKILPCVCEGRCLNL